MLAPAQLAERIEALSGDVHAQAAEIADYILATRWRTELEAIRSAFDVAATARWFNSNLLQDALKISAEEAMRRIAMLKKLPFVEETKQESWDSYSIHEVTRFGWQSWLRLFEQRPAEVKWIPAGLC